MTLPSSETSVSDKPAHLSSASQPVQQEIDKEVLNPAAKVVESFDFARPLPLYFFSCPRCLHPRFVTNNNVCYANVSRAMSV